MSEIEFDSPIKRILKDFEPKNKFGIDTSLPDLAFLRQLSIQGRLIQAQGSRTAAGAGDIITLTPNSGETFFIYSMHLASTGVSSWTITNKGVTRGVFISLGSVGSTGIYDAPFFDSIVGDGTSTFVINGNTTAGTRVATILGWRENTSRIRDVT